MKTILLLIIAATLCTTTVARPIASLELVEKACNVVDFKGRICQHLLSFVALTQSEAPTAREIVAKLLKNRYTKTVLKSAWQKSHFQKDIYQERGGWIFADPNNPNKLQVVLARKSASKPFRLNGNTNPAINLEDVSSAKKGWILVANFHTHPLYVNQEPSFADVRNAFRRGLPGIVIARGRIWTYGPEKREDFATTKRPGAYPEDNDMSNFNPNQRGSVRSVANNPFPTIP